MSFVMTIKQFKSQSKTVTHRFKWGELKEGDVMQIVMKPSKKPLGLIRIISIRKQQLNEITQKDVIKEGFPNWTPEQFMENLINHYNISPNLLVNRIEFEYL